MKWFEVDKKGLAKLLERRGKSFVVLELIQNAWDQNVSRVEVRLEKPSGSRYVNLTVEDDDPDGFSDLTQMFTLFAESGKKADPEKRGRFNLGEKLVLAVCDEAKIVTVRGGYRFDSDGRHTIRERREAGSVFTGRLLMNQVEYEECVEAVRRLIPPLSAAVTTFNGESLKQRKPIGSFEVALPTEVADDEGRLRRVTRSATVHVYEPNPGETPMLYELGIPVVETGDRWHIDVLQKVPLNLERDNVPPGYLKTLRVNVVNHLHDRLTDGDANAHWVREGIGDARASDAAVQVVTRLRFGERAVAFDPSDPEANKLAVSKGYTVVHGGSLSQGEWENVRRAGAVLPAGRVTPSPKPYSPDGKPLTLLDRGEWSAGMTQIAEYASYLARKILGISIRVEIAREPHWPFGATYGRGELVLNYGRLGRAWFDQGVTEDVNLLLIHEFAHQYSPDHLSAAYHDALCRIGAKLVTLALEEPDMFAMFSMSPEPESRRSTVRVTEPGL